MFKNEAQDTIGVEYELIVPRHYDPAGVRDHVQLKGDGSIRYFDDSRQVGIEIASKPRRGDEFIAQQEAIGQWMSEQGATVNRSCGLHVHIDGRLPDGRLIDEDAQERMKAAWARHEPIFYSLCYASRKRNRYCRPGWSHARYECWHSDCQGRRYHAMNFEAIERHGTVEFRLHHGTNDSRVATAWAVLLAYWKKWAQTQTEYTDSTVRATRYTPQRLAKFLSLVRPPMWTWRVLRNELRTHAPAQWHAIQNRKGTATVQRVQRVARVPRSTVFIDPAWPITRQRATAHRAAGRTDCTCRFCATDNRRIAREERVRAQHETLATAIHRLENR